jgi:hypothetical protein
MKSKNRSTENWLPVRDIINGTIVLDNNERVTGVKVSPKNIFILDEDSQANVINGLKNFYNTVDFEFWLIVSDRVVDISLYQSQLQLLYNTATKPKLRKLIMQDINKGNQFMGNNVVDTEYYILFKERKPEIVQKNLRNIINGLASCGLNSVQVSNEDLRTLVENFLNGGMNTEYGTVISV